MSRLPYLIAVLLAAARQTSCDNATLTTLATLSDDTCELQPWEAALEDWATADRSLNTRHGRIMVLPPTQGYYVSDRIDLVPPPPPRQHLLHRGPYPAHSSSNTHHGSNSPGHSYNYHSNPSNPPSPSYHNPAHPPSPPGPSYSNPPNPPSPPGPSYSNPPNPPSPSGPSYSNPPNPPSPPGPSYNESPSSSYNQPPSNPSYNQPSGPQYQPPGPPNQAASSYNPGPSSPRPQPSSMPYDEWQATPPPPPGAGKIVNRPPNPYKDQFKPSFAPPSPSIPVQSVADRVDASPPPPPHKQVSETDLHLLRAIEKLVYRVDLMEKRLRKMEENMLYIVAGNKPDTKPEACPGNFTRLGSGCYHISSDVANWKGASFACRKLKANLLEMGYDEKKQFVRGIQTDKRFKGADFWTGGLNPGLLWIWSHSAKPVANTTSADAELTSSIQGEGRCLALVHTQTDYVYKGQDCALRHRYVCEREEDPERLGNEIERVARTLRVRGRTRGEGKGRTAKILWTEAPDDDAV